MFSCGSRPTFCPNWIIQIFNKSDILFMSYSDIHMWNNNYLTVPRSISPVHRRKSKFVVICTCAERSFWIDCSSAVQNRPISLRNIFQNHQSGNYRLSRVLSGRERADVTGILSLHPRVSASSDLKHLCTHPELQPAVFQSQQAILFIRYYLTCLTQGKASQLDKIITIDNPIFRGLKK